MLTSPAQILRDSSIVAMLLVGGGWYFGAVGATAGGAFAGSINLLLMWRAVSAPTGSVLIARVIFAHVAALALLALLLSTFPAVPVLVGFCGPLLAIALRGAAGLLRRPSSLSAEHG